MLTAQESLANRNVKRKRLAGRKRILT